jgi:hypothetical protein
MHIFLYFLAGLLAANGVPHFVKGITGEQHQTPFGNPSSAVVNVLWGSLNFAVAFALWRYAKFNTDHLYRYAVAFGVGGVVAAVLLAQQWAKTPPKSAKKS